jgi:hypothetical protein
MPGAPQTELHRNLNCQRWRNLSLALFARPRQSLRISNRSEQALWRVQRDSGCNSFLRFQFDGGHKLRPLLNCLVNQRSLPTMFG